MTYDLILVATLGFLGSFGHCVSMCGPLALAFSFPRSPTRSLPLPWWHSLRFQVLLNLGRLVSYALVGAGIGAIGSVLIAGGQLAGLDSILRQSIAWLTGSLLVWFSLAQIQPNQVPKLPLLHPLVQAAWHQRLSTGMNQLAAYDRWWTPALLGMVWGLIPCGFLYVAQIKAAETGSLWQGALTMLAFGAGTSPVMVGLGISLAKLGADRRSQLFRLGGWITLAIGLLTLLRTGDMLDYTGYLALGLLSFALIARPLSKFWKGPLIYRRLLGVGAFLLALVHMGYRLEHTFSWRLTSLPLLLPQYQFGIWLGMLAIALMLPLALTSSDRMVQVLGPSWQRLHGLAIPALILTGCHIILIGSHYLGNLNGSVNHQIRSVLLLVWILAVLLTRQRWIWRLLSLEECYADSTVSAATASARQEHS